MSMKRLALFFLTLMMGLGWATAQNRTVTGTVISSSDKQPIIGANVVVVGQTTIGTTTDFDGNFKLSVPMSAKKLRISYVGMKAQEVKIKKVMKVTLRDNKELETVVVLGYGSGQKLSTVSGSVARVSSEKLENKPVANVMDGLQGQVAGMEVSNSSGDPNQVASVTIHGNASLGAGGAPLYIVDGVQTSSSVVMAMNPNDFASMTVLKDASSTSIYGARAANGVIVITTKRGKLNQDGRISVSAMYGISTLLTRRPFEEMMSANELLQYQLKHSKDKSKFLKGFVGTAFDVKNQVNKKNIYTGPDYDWLPVFMKKTAPTVQADMSISGGTDNISYYVSGGYFSQKGISMTTNFYNKINLRSNIDARVKEWLRVGVNISGGVVQRKTGSIGGPSVDSGPFAAMIIPRYYSPFNKDKKGKDLATYASLFKFAQGYPALADSNGELYTPGYMNDKLKRLSTSYRLNVSGYAQVRPITGLTLKTQAGLDMIIGDGVSRVYPTYPHYNGLGTSSRSYSNSRTFTWTNTAEYKWNLNDENKFTFLLGQEFVDNKYAGFSAASRGLTNKDFMFLNHGRTGSYLVQPSESESEYAFFSLFGRVNYTFNNFVAADVTLRNDRSSRFGKNHQSATFFSVGSMFDFIRAELVEANDVMSTLRLKLNYGTQGNSSIPLYASNALLGTIHYTEDIAFGVVSIGNPDLSWERQGMLSAGVDLGLFDDRLKMDLSYYHRKTTNMLMNVPLPYSTGYSARWQNVGAMTNQGVDFTLEYNFIRTKEWNAYFNTTLNFNAERVDKLFSEKTNKDGYVVGAIKYEVGKPIRYYYPRFAGIDRETGKQLWWKTDENGKRVKTDVYSDKLKETIDYARVSPYLTGGFSMGVTWRNQLSLSMDWNYSVGAWSMNNTRFFTEGNSDSFLYVNRSKKLLKEWSPKMPKNFTPLAPKYDEQLVFDDRLLENTSYLRLKNLQLSYTFPKSLLKKQNFISGVKVYFSSRNLATICSKSFTGFDPEASGAQGIAINVYPNTTQFVGGLQLMF